MGKGFLKIKSIKDEKFPQMEIFLQTQSMELLLNIRDSSDKSV